MTDERARRLAEIRARHAASTPGEWVAKHNPHRIAGNPYCYWVSANDGGCALDEEGDFEQSNAEFIAHAHQDVPFLLAEVERLERELDAWAESDAEAHGVEVESDTPMMFAPTATRKMQVTWKSRE